MTGCDVLSARSFGVTRDAEQGGLPQEGIFLFSQVHLEGEEGDCFGEVL